MPCVVGEQCGAWCDCEARVCGWRMSCGMGKGVGRSSAIQRTGCRVMGKGVGRSSAIQRRGCRVMGKGVGRSSAIQRRGVE
eukprot:353149-Chlamydomonas_euryale.AAC.3